MPPCFSDILFKVDNFCDFLFASMDDETIFERRSNPKGKNLLLKHPIYHIYFAIRQNFPLYIMTTNN